MSPLLDLKEVAVRLRVHYETARYLVVSGKLRAVRLGGRRRWQVTEEDLERFVEASKTGPEVGPIPHRGTLERPTKDRSREAAKARPHEWRARYAKK